MRAVAMLVLGMAIGALGTVTAIGAMKQETPVTKASMALMGHHFGALREMAKSERCDATQIARHVRGLQALSSEFAAFVPTGGDDTAFESHAAGFGTAIEGVAAAPPLDCKTLATANQTIGGACKTCHEEFRH